MEEIEKVKENFDKRNFPTQTRILFEESGQPKAARKADKLVGNFWKYIIRPEIRPQATTKISSMHGGSKKKSGAQLLEKLESKKEEPKELELEVPIHEPVTTNTGKRVYHRDARGRFTRHAFHSAISEISQPQKGDLGMPQPPSEEPLQPIPSQPNFLEREEEIVPEEPAEEFESFAGNKRKEISGKEAARREALSKRMKERGTKREKEAEEKFISRMKK